MGDENPAIKKPKSLISRWTLAPLKQVLQRFNIFHSDTKTEPSIGLPDLPSDSVSTVPTNRQESEHVSITICTAVPPPDHLTVDSVDTTSATVNWRHPPGLDQTHHHYQISYHCPGTEPHTTTTSTTSITLSDLRPVTEYSVTVWTVMEDEQLSEWVPTNFTTRSFLKELLSKTGLSDHFPNKLMLSKVLEINANTTSDEPLTTVQSLPGSFLKKLMMANVKARSSNSMSTDTNVSCRGIDSFDNVENDSDNVHPLDLITAVFLCSYGILQQEMVQKMSMCQFAVPLLLPNCDTKQSTLMLWALRDIVKKFRPSSQANTKSFREERIVVSDVPMVSFVRLGECSLSKSQILNKLLSNAEQYHDTFVHRDMECGDVPRRISDGLVEISWYFPCGNRNIDIFTEPVAVANLRGDIRSFEIQFSFLCQTSAAVFIFSDDLEDDVKVFAGKNTKADMFLVVNSQAKLFSIDTLRKFITDYNITKDNVIVKKKQSDAQFVKTLQSSIFDITEKSPNKCKVQEMTTIACQLGILVDEKCDECQNAKKNAEAITSNIKDTVQFKREQLPLQGKIWTELSKLEKEMCRLKKAGKQEIEQYKCSLRRKYKELRAKQQSIEMTDSITYFLIGMSSSGPERCHFLKWMQIQLDNLSRQNLSGLREKYKNLQEKESEKKEMAYLDKQQKEIFELDRQISDCSLGLEHFLREVGQLYESVCSLPKDHPQRKQMERLPRLCAQMLLDGFPVELVDGDASNIPLNWISAVLTQLHILVKSNSKICVVTVLGVQSTGKSTLLNTMFGVQFAVSSGRCTRGAFMQLININKDLKEELKCDFIMVIDTEGLKSPELAQLDDSYEHDNELATLVIGLSDVTIINISMENSTEMKDVLQIVVHAFIRMKEVGKKPICHFVHQNVSDISAYDNNMRDRKKLLKQLNEMTQAAARMEKKENITKFTDVMDYDPDTNSTYIPGLWRGTPPMAPVNAGYSEAVYDFKKSLMQDFRKCKKNDITHFMTWTKSLWESVKFENFIFHFRNSFVADAYTRLCTEYNGWEWAFQKEMYSWKMHAETSISNFGMTGVNTILHSVKSLLEDLLSKASEKLSLEEKKIQDNLAKYFENQEGHVSLVEKYREDFVASAKTLRRETENKLKDTLHAAVEIKEGMTKVEEIKSSHASTLEKKVLDLLLICRQKKSDLSDQNLREEFEIMWKETLSEINFRGLPIKNVAQEAFLVLGGNLSTRGSYVKSMLVGNSLANCGKNPFEVKSLDWCDKAKGLTKHRDPHYYRKKLQDLCDVIIAQCQKSITQIVGNKSDYHDTYIKELLKSIDDTLLQPNKRKVSEECEVSLKLHICGIAVREFQNMHDHFITVNDPRKCLEKSKSKYLNDFIDLFHERDQCQKKAEDFTKLCLQPAVLDYVTKMIGPDVVDEMKTGKGSEDYNTRGAFQFSILKQLLTDGEYEKYEGYIRKYEQFVKDWLFEHIVNQLSKENGLERLKNKHLKDIVKLITDAIEKVRNTTNIFNDIKMFIQHLCVDLGDKLVIPKDVLDSIMTLNCSKNTEQFADNLTVFVGEMKQSLADKYDHEMDIEKHLRSLPFKPQDKMFTSLFGCGEVCPFCKAPCEAGGKEHSKHFTSIHRPQGVSGWRNKDTQVLVTRICSSSVISNGTFSNTLTKDQPHPYKDYQKYYPDWIITGDSSVEASDYWKYVMATFNERIAKETNAHPAVIPTDWKALTLEDAMKSLKMSFNIRD
uniref:Uncharacterized protein n=2 Tax=Esox lucius TaxID=8010 RepID=A0A6Q2WYR2_ESOLU